MQASSPTWPRPLQLRSLNESRLLAVLMLFGSLALGMVWALDLAMGRITRWDLWAYPALIAICLVGLAVVLLRPARILRAKLLVIAALNIHLVGSVHMTLFTGDGPLETHKLVASLFWMPLCLSGAFVMLPLTAALACASATLLLGFVPIALASISGAPARWGPDFASLAVHLALAQATIVLTLMAIAALRSDHRRAQAHADEMSALASTDALTNLPNRRQLTQALSAQLALAKRGAQAVSVLLIDIDHFKRINDSHGHAAGDKVLVLLGEMLGKDRRASDHVGRWGGEEFLGVLPATTLAQANDLAERLRGQVHALPLDGVGPVSVSIGVSQARADDTLDTLLQRADKALYRAKENGRNRVEC